MNVTAKYFVDLSTKNNLPGYTFLKSVIKNEGMSEIWFCVTLQHLSVCASWVYLILYLEVWLQT